MAFKQALIINSDLKMDKGKIVVQAAHGEIMYMEAVNDAIFPVDAQPNYDNYIKWREYDIKPIGMMTKVVMKATQLEMTNLIKVLKDNSIWAQQIFDKGLTQVKPESLTCLIVEPIPEEEHEKFFSHLKLL